MNDRNLAAYPLISPPIMANFAMFAFGARFASQKTVCSRGQCKYVVTLQELFDVGHQGKDQGRY